MTNTGDIETLGKASATGATAAPAEAQEKGGSKARRSPRGRR